VIQRDFGFFKETDPLPRLAPEPPWNHLGTTFEPLSIRIFYFRFKYPIIQAIRNNPEKYFSRM
jgi:hypothetical protein